jgi:UDP-N-acetylglucosamine acyltransferase
MPLKEEIVLIHPTAIVDKGAKLGKNVAIGPYSVVEDGTEIGDDTKLWNNVFVAKGTTIGKSCQIHMNVVLGHEPQDVAFEGKPSFLTIGDRNIIREFVTVHRGTKEGSATTIGNDNFIMGLCHIAHNCRIGNRVIMVNNTLLAGYVEIDDMAFVSGNCVVHQFTRLGKLVMASASTRINKDVPPYMLVERDSLVSSYNLIGLRRAGLDAGIRDQIKKAFNILYRSDLNIKNAVEKIDSEMDSPEIKYLVDFVRSSNRGICAFRRRRLYKI